MAGSEGGSPGYAVRYVAHLGNAAYIVTPAPRYVVLQPQFRIADIWRPRTRIYAPIWNSATISTQLERVRPSSQDNTQHSRRQILTSADPPCAFFTMQEKTPSLLSCKVIPNDPANDRNPYNMCRAHTAGYSYTLYILPEALYGTERTHPLSYAHHNAAGVSGDVIVISDTSQCRGAGPPMESAQQAIRATVFSKRRDEIRSRPTAYARHFPPFHYNIHQTKRKGLVALDGLQKSNEIGWVRIRAAIGFTRWGVLSSQVPAHPCRKEVIGVYPLLVLFMLWSGFGARGSVFRWEDGSGGCLFLVLCLLAVRLFPKVGTVFLIWTIGTFVLLTWE
ncbi:hypothetical protein PCH_Pc20g12190 [Penicillium rubens Wisconsin 54-1255]|uniref:Uncharacterized protein n=1 Tax=Penicillium rubens (strain ATCC 28089 / DSM 1075 / NRRL 1951 / Wisconsin 54-1255) TaxID=500485 RepID=B6HGI0_PENRW|nr:hypothetical protein PCH_Pc20g12190 [Penicillium rubens Wisconsin 54-1255]